MEPDDLGLGSYYHHHHPQPPPPQPPQRHQQQLPQQQPQTTTTLTNGMLQNTNVSNDPRPSQLLYPHSSAPSVVSSPLETGVRRKRGRPRKYGTPEQAAAAKRLSSSSSLPALSSPVKKDLSLGVGGGSSFKKYSLGNSGQGFTPHVISVTAGEDVGQKLMSFMQQSKQEMCVLSASGSISNASLRQPATSGGNITYEGRFDILSLCGSYVRTDFGGTTGGLSVCLSSNDGQIIGGGIDGSLIAAGPVQVIVGTFAIEGKKEIANVIKVDPSTNKLPSPNVGPSVPNLGFLSPPDPSGRNVVSGNDEQQNIDGYQFMIPNRNLPVSDWRNNNDSRNTSGFDFSGRVNHGTQQSPKNGDYDRFQD